MSKNVLITGGSEGIGYAFAKQFCKEGYSVHIAARHIGKLTDTKSALEKLYPQGHVEIHVCDLSKKEDIDLLLNQIKDIDFDVLVNNAGIGYEKDILNTSDEEDERLTALNITAVMRLSKYFAADFVEKGSGLIVNLASTGAFQPGPHIASYYASKAFVLSYSRALGKELEGTGAAVCCVCPGPVDTAFYKKSGGTMSRFHMTPDQVVSYSLRHMKKAVVVPGLLNRILRIVPVAFKMNYLMRSKTNHG